MTARNRLAIASSLFILAVLVAAGLGLAPAVLAQEDATDSSDNETYGTQVSAFMQASAADTSHSVDAGMWEAELNDSADPNETVTERAETLKQRRAALENRTEQLRAEYEAGALNETAYQAQASALRRQIANMNDAVDHANSAAQARGVNTTRLDRLRTRASNMTGPEVSLLARNLTDVGGGPPADTPGNGPPDDVGNGDAGPGNVSPGDNDPDNAGSGDAGPPGNETNRSGNGGGTGNGPSPDDGSNPENGGGPGDGGGPGGPPDDPGDQENGTIADVAN